MTMHEMRLHPEPFDMIWNGTKTIEIRLNDEKRQLMRVGDSIEFSSRADPDKKIRAEITGLDHFPSFQEAFGAYPPEQYGGKSKDDWKIMYTYYSLEEESVYGVLGIHLKRLSQ